MFLSNFMPPIFSRNESVLDRPKIFRIWPAARDPVLCVALFFRSATHLDRFLASNVWRNGSESFMSKPLVLENVTIPSKIISTVCVFSTRNERMSYISYNSLVCLGFCHKNVHIWYVDMPPLCLQSSTNPSVSSGHFTSMFNRFFSTNDLRSRRSHGTPVSSR